MGTKLFVRKNVAFIKIPKHVERKALKCWQGLRSLHEMLWTDLFLCTLSHVFSFVFTHMFVDSSSRSRNWSLPMSAAISMVRLRTHVNTPFSHLKRLLCNGPHISHLDSQIVKTSQVTPEDLSVQLTGAGVGRGPCEGVSKIQFYGQRGATWKYSTWKMAFYVFKKLRTAFLPQKQALWSVGCWHKFYGQHFLRIFKLSIKLLPAADPLPEQRLQGALWLCFPDSLKSELLALPHLTSPREHWPLPTTDKLTMLTIWFGRMLTCTESNGLACSLAQVGMLMCS